jgi:hypothetical protein
MEQVHPLVYEYKQTIIGFDPPAFAKMLETGASRKYTKIYRRLSNGLLKLTCEVTSLSLSASSILPVQPEPSPSTSTKEARLHFLQCSPQHDNAAS